ncbi:hypothetical protein GCM10010425_02350 [Streptomyces spororaveus]|uniref:Uncharacterized protein n=1 Tax=Streptomyces spororaveus TaxID=284039 RepID=A0ABQ3TD07_9ACTN|nr:hypothetical protein Sspor_38140 [Streptomyces spororaveus]
MRTPHLAHAAPADRLDEPVPARQHGAPTCLLFHEIPPLSALQARLRSPEGLPEPPGRRKTAL